jgi:hypothetical protein
MNKIHKFIEDKVGKGVLDLSDKKKPKVIKAEPKKTAKKTAKR